LNIQGGKERVEERFPSLSSLCIVLSFENDQLEIFRNIFPDVDDGGQPIEIQQLKYLAISLPFSCESEEGRRLHAMFPALLFLKHLRR
jgi:hypothetical protein